MLDKLSRGRDILVRVQAKTFPGETVCLCGSSPEIGEWQVGNALALTQESAENETWSGLIRFSGDAAVEFRYLVAILLEPTEKHQNRDVVVRRWETNLHPRVLGVDSGNSLDVFGCYGAGGQEMIGPGWLMKESIVHLKFYNNPVTIWKHRYRNKSYSIHISAIDLSKRDSETNISLDESEQDSSLYDLKAAQWPLIEVATMNENDWAYAQQDQFGRIYNSDDFMIFRAQMLDPNSIAYMVDFYSVNNLDSAPEHIGFCYILPSNLRETSGTCTMPITGKRQQPIGQLTVEYLLVRPLPDFTCDCRISYAQHWKSVKKGLDVGHRGAGNARRTDKVENVLENTVASFNYAARHGADMVELDVQLSKDKIPVIYHDYFICISMKKRKQVDHELLQVSVKDLTAQQLQKLKLSPASITDSKHQYDFCEDDHEDNQPFPTLQYVLQAVEPRIGFNVEIKCPMQYRDGTWEMTQGFELNSYIDIILQTLMEHAGSRFIILSCFHPDICTMVRLKQNKYPLLFLTQGQTDKYPPYLDTRTSSIPMAVYFALNTSLLGINVHTEELLRNRSLIQFVKSHKLTLFCWGEDNNASEMIKSLKKDGVDGVIYDKVDEFRTTTQETTAPIFLVGTTSRVALLEAAGHSADSSLNWSSSISADSSSP